MPLLPVIRLSLLASILPMLIHPNALGAEPAGRPPVADVLLGPGGALHGQLVDSSGRPAAEVEIRARQRERVAAVARTDSSGRFVLTGLRGGVYTLESIGAAAEYRVWTAQAAPPSARREVLVVTGEPTLRGQAWRSLNSPWVLGAVAGATIAAPFILEEDDQPAASN